MNQRMAYSGASLTQVASLRGPFSFSVAFHLLIFGSLLVSTLFSHRGEQWGGPGTAAISVNLVGHLAGVPMPKPDVATPSRVVDESKGLYKSEPKPPEPPAPAKQIPEFARNKPPKYVPTRPSKVLEDNSTPPPNAIPYGGSGPPSLPYTPFTMAGTTPGGMQFSGGGAGGDFAGRFPLYVEAVRNRISSNWLQSMIDPSIRFAPRVVVTFQILRDGRIANIQITRPSGMSSVDASAIRAIQDSNPLGPLPSEYSGSNVNVEFWFDFKR